MKKIIFRLFFLIVLFWAGFFYIVKNPDFPLSIKVLNTLWISTQQDTIVATGTTTTGIDLTNCISYFDGCNNCSVVDGKPSACTKMYCETPSEPKCTQYATGSTTTSIDLTNCVGYFDGCNNCSVKDGKPDACTEMFCETITEPKCTQYATGTEPTPSVGLANPGNELTICTMEYAPVCASIAIQCITTPCNPVEQTFGNKCQMNANKLTTFLHDGECRAK